VTATPDELARWYAAAWNEHEVVGIDALDATIAELQASGPEGVDVRAELGDDGKMKTIVVFIDPDPPPIRSASP